MKRILIVLVFLASVPALWAQKDNMNIQHARVSNHMPIRMFFGPRIGINYANVITWDMPNESGSTTGIIGVNIGAFAEMQIRNWFSITLDVMYNSNGFKLDNTKYINSNIIAPVLANFYVVDNLALKIGIQPGMLIHSLGVKDQEKATVTDNFKRFNLDIPVGISYTLWDRIVVDLRYTIGLLNMDATGRYGLRNSGLSLSAGWKF